MMDEACMYITVLCEGNSGTWLVRNVPKVPQLRSLKPIPIPFKPLRFLPTYFPFPLPTSGSSLFFSTLSATTLTLTHSSLY